MVPSIVLVPMVFVSLLGRAGFTCRGCDCGIAVGESGLMWGIPLSGGGGGPQMGTGVEGSMSDSELDSNQQRDK